MSTSFQSAPSTRPAANPDPEGEVPPIVAEIDRAALAHNLHAVRRRVGTGVRILSVVKADAYGHGATECAKSFVAAGADWLGVARAPEGVALRRAGLAVPVCVLSGLMGGDADEVVAHRLTPLVYRADHLEALASAVRRAGHARFPVHVKIDTGMGRFGALPEESGALMDALSRQPQLELEGLATHLARADADDAGSVGRQLAQFDAVRQSFAARGLRPSMVHLANSAGVLGFARAHGDMVRPGLMLYGVAPDAFREGAADLRPALSWKTRIVHLKEVPAGFGVGYGHAFVAARDTRLAVLPVGYADGLPVPASNRAQVLVGGRRVPLVGRVCMDACMVDVTDLPQVAVGDEAVLIGSQGEDSLGAADLAAAAGTLSYEILCGIGARVPRVYR